MSDPFDRLRGSSEPSAPDLGAIKARALRIVRRRYTVLAGAAALIVLAGIGGVLVSGPGEERSARSLAQGRSETRDEATAKPSPQAVAAQALRADTSAGEPYASAAPRAESSEQERAAAAGPGAASQAPTYNDGPPGFDVRLEINDESLGPRRGVGFILRTCNHGDQPVELSFDTSQRYDFEVGRDGVQTWRWGLHQSFAQAQGTERWEPGECKNYSEWWDGMDDEGKPAPPGRYKGYGTLTTSSPHPILTPQQDFCLDAC
jgi:hypothetical protein